MATILAPFRAATRQLLRARAAEATQIYLFGAATRAAAGEFLLRERSAYPVAFPPSRCATLLSLLRFSILSCAADSPPAARLRRSPPAVTPAPAKPSCFSAPRLLRHSLLAPALPACSGAPLLLWHYPPAPALPLAPAIPSALGLQVRNAVTSASNPFSTFQLHLYFILSEMHVWLVIFFIRNACMTCYFILSEMHLYLHLNDLLFS